MNKKPISIALAAVLLAFPLSSVIAQASIPTTPVEIASTVPTTEAVTPVVEPVVNTDVVDATGKLVIAADGYSDFIAALQQALTFNPEHKAELNKRHAYRKLAQAQQYMKDGNIEACKIAFSVYKDKIAKAQEFLEAAADPTTEIAENLAKALAKVDAKNIQVLTALIESDKLPPQAAVRLGLNVVRTMEKAVVKIQKEEAKVDTAETPVVPTDIEKEDLEKQAKAALTDFKKAVNEKDKAKVDKEVKDDRSKTERIQSELNQQLKKLSQPTLRTSDDNNDGRSEQERRDTNNREDNNQGDDNNREDHR